VITRAAVPSFRTVIACPALVWPTVELLNNRLTGLTPSAGATAWPLPCNGTRSSPLVAVLSITSVAVRTNPVALARNAMPKLQLSPGRIWVQLSTRVVKSGALVLMSDTLVIVNTPSPVL